MQGDDGDSGDACTTMARLDGDACTTMARLDAHIGKEC
jgi:hypothetical protein